jgi:hypothetical protein
MYTSVRRCECARSVMVPRSVSKIREAISVYVKLAISARLILSSRVPWLGVVERTERIMLAVNSQRTVGFL